MRSSDPGKRLALSYFNRRLMLADVYSAMSKLQAEQKDVGFQAGIAIGLTAAKHVLDGNTADEAWALLEPVMAALHEVSDT